MNVTYYTHMGSDNMVCDMARASFGKKAEGFTHEQNANLIKYLARGMSKKDQDTILAEAANSEDFAVLLDCFKRMNAHTHWAPMAHPQITLFIEVPLFVARQDFKHIVGFVRSETSRRYIDTTPEIYTPEWRQRPDVGIKQGSGSNHQDADKWSERYTSFCTESLNLYNEMIEDNIAPEQARMVLPTSMMTTYFTTGSLAAWARAFNQRIDTHAQVEIQEEYKQVGNIMKTLFPLSWEALTG